MNFFMMKLVDIVLLLALLCGCASENGYQKAFSEQSTPISNSRTYRGSVEQILKVVKQVLVRQGFTVDHIDVATGLIKAAKNMQDSTNSDVSYMITLSTDVTPTATDSMSVLTLAASQQTVLHRKVYTWWHLLWLVPIFPTGSEYQTVVTNEGNVLEDRFYLDFFAAVDKGLPTSSDKNG